MERIKFENIKEFICDLAYAHDESIDNQFAFDVDIIAMPKEAREMIECLVDIGGKLKSIHLDSDDFNFKYPYVISLISHKTELEVWCEPFQRDGKYLKIEEDKDKIVYVLDNCPAAVLKNIECKDVFEVAIYDDDFEDLDDDEYDDLDEDDEDLDEDLDTNTVSHSWYDKDGSYHYVSVTSTNLNDFFDKLFKL